jgi:HAD superfamily hydrolase (TIGR01509 family)
VVFDMDGLMLDTEVIYKTAWQAASAELGYVIDDALWTRFVGRPNADCERDLLARFGTAYPLDRFRGRWPALWKAEAAASGIQRKAGLLDLLAFLERRRVPIAVATSTEADDAAFCLDAAGLAERFAVIVTGDQVARGKPAPDIYLEAARRLEVDPEQCVALEDSEAGILAAHQAGMLPLLIPDGAPPSPVATSAAFRVLSSLSEAERLLRSLLQRGVT